MRVLFLGQKWIGERCFEVLVRAGVDIAAVVSNECRDRWWGSNRVFERAGELGIPCLDNSSRREAEIASLIAERAVDTLLCVQHPWLLGASILESVAGRAVNFHQAKLPEYKGHNAVNHVILNGDRTYTVTAHRMVLEADSGAIVAEASFEIDPRHHARSLYEEALDYGVALFDGVIRRLVAGEELEGDPMPPGGAFYPRSSLDELREVPADASPAEVNRRARALYFPPFEPAYRIEGGKKVYVLPPGVE